MEIDLPCGEGERRAARLRDSTAFGAIGGRNGSAMLMHDAFGDGESQAGSLGVQAAGHERVEDIGQHVGRDAGAIVFHRDRDPGLTVAVDAPWIDGDLAPGADGVERVAKQVDEDLDQTVGIAGDDVIGRDVVGEAGLRSFFVDGDQTPGVVD